LGGAIDDSDDWQRSETERIDKVFKLLCPVAKRFFDEAVLPAFGELREEFTSRGITMTISPLQESQYGPFIQTDESGADYCYNTAAEIAGGGGTPKFRFQVTGLIWAGRRRGDDDDNPGLVSFESTPYRYGGDGWEEMQLFKKAYVASEHHYTHLSSVTMEEVIQDFLDAYLPLSNPRLMPSDSELRAKKLPVVLAAKAVLMEKHREASYPFPVLEDDRLVEFNGEVVGGWLIGAYNDLSRRVISVYLLPSGEFVSMPGDWYKLEERRPRVSRFDPESVDPVSLDAILDRLRGRIRVKPRVLPRDRWDENRHL
jgi:hypothetical protein